VLSDNKFCSRCGAALQPGMMYCPRCGTAVSPSTAPPSGAPPTTTPPPTSGPPPTDWREQRRQWRAQRRAQQYEKYEKGEKHTEKAEKGTRGGGIIGPIMGGSILIWLGVTFYLEQTNYLPASDWWAYFLAGIGVIIIIQGLLSYALYRGPFIGSFIGGAILIAIGLGFIGNFADFWPLILIVIGIALLASSLTARRRRPPPPPATAS
jgi:hypothetical protein